MPLTTKREATVAELIECKSCGKEIAKSAKTCPHCGAKNKGGGFLKWIGIIFVVLIVIAVLNSGREVDDSTSTQSAAMQTIAIGDSFTWRDFEVRIDNHKVARTLSDGMMFEASAQPGAILVVAAVDYKNVGSKPANSALLPDLKLVSPDNVSYKQDLGKGAVAAAIFDIDMKVMSNVNPGLRTQDIFVFEISEELWNRGGWHFEFDGVRNLKVAIQ